MCRTWWRTSGTPARFRNLLSLSLGAGGWAACPGILTPGQQGERSQAGRKLYPETGTFGRVDLMQRRLMQSRKGRKEDLFVLIVRELFKPFFASLATLRGIFFLDERIDHGVTKGRGYRRVGHALVNRGL